MSGAAPCTMLNESSISPNDSRSRSGPPSRLAATQEPDRNAVLKPALAVSLALSPSQTAGITTKPGSANKARKRAGAFMGASSLRELSPDDSRRQRKMSCGSWAAAAAASGRREILQEAADRLGEILALG